MTDPDRREPSDLGSSNEPDPEWVEAIHEERRRRARRLKELLGRQEPDDPEREGSDRP
ncbi:MAG TPA: hypothetical protein VIC58_02850 [Actinomycetota bacterium]|jgi:hypothetical protein